MPASEAQDQNRLNGAGLLIAALKAAGVSTVFGYPGGAVLPIYDHLFDEPLEHILVRHEQAAAHAADGYYRASGKLAACLATSGPGATNLVTGLATAHLDSIPLLAITGQAPTPVLGRDGFQEADVRGITMPVTKHNYLVQEVRDIGPTIAEAAEVALGGRPGPVLVDIPKDILVEPLPSVPSLKILLQSQEDIHHGRRPAADPSDDILQAAALLKTAQHPLLIAGGGVVHAGGAGALARFQDTTGIPVASTLMGLGSFRGRAPDQLGMVGMHGTYTANKAVTQADVILAIGMRFDDRVTGKLAEFAKQASIIHIDIDPSEHGKNLLPVHSIHADARQALETLAEAVPALSISSWRDQLKKWAADHPLRWQERKDGQIAPQAVITTLAEVTGGEAILSTGVGQHQMWAAQYFPFSGPNQLLTSGGLGTMGYGLPAAVGAAAAQTGLPVICLEGDGGFQMTAQELATIKSYQLPVKVIIINNGVLGMVRQWQSLFHNQRFASISLENPDFVKLAQAYGIPAWQVSQAANLKAALGQLLKCSGPALLDIQVPADDNVFPMIPAGAAVSELIESESELKPTTQ